MCVLLFFNDLIFTLCEMICTPPSKAMHWCRQQNYFMLITTLFTQCMQAFFHLFVTETCGA